MSDLDSAAPRLPSRRGVVDDITDDRTSDSTTG
jgi:hypothetical protein